MSCFVFFSCIVISFVALRCLTVAMVPLISVFFQKCLRDLLSRCAADVSNHTEVSLRPRPQCPGLDKSLQSARVSSLSLVCLFFLCI